MLKICYAITKAKFNSYYGLFMQIHILIDTSTIQLLVSGFYYIKYLVLFLLQFVFKYI